MDVGYEDTILLTVKTPIYCGYKSNPQYKRFPHYFKYETLILDFYYLT